jgi:pilus assembly protein CpaF
MQANRVFQLVDELSRKSGITELIINDVDNVFVEKDGELLQLDIAFTEQELDQFSQQVAALNRKEFGPEVPVFDGNLADGSRVNLIHKDYTGRTHAITIRRYLKSIQNFEGSPGIFGLDDRWVHFLKLMVKARLNIVVSGGTGVGKTTFLNLLLNEVPYKDRIITIEDTRELQIGQSNIVRLEARPQVGNRPGLTIRQLVKNTLRMRPDRIIVGEVRGEEVFDLLQAMNTGHEGSMTSVHANSPGECLMRLENLYLLSGHEVPLRALRYQISTAVDYIIQLRRDKDGRRIIHQVTEIAGMEGDRVLMQDIGSFKSGELKFTALVPSRIQKLHQAGLPKDFFLGL